MILSGVFSATSSISTPPSGLATITGPLNSLNRIRFGKMIRKNGQKVVHKNVSNFPRHLFLQSITNRRKREFLIKKVITSDLE